METEMSKDTKMKYSNSEQKLLDLIPTDGSSISTEELAVKRYEGEKVPFNSRGIVLATLSQLIRKVDHNKENYKIRKGRRMGPIPLEIWVEKRRGR